jgi:DNA-binding transcriptional ArsR family regulator
MLRIQFTIEDIARTRIAARPDPLWELVLALHMLRRQPGDQQFSLWRGQARKALLGLGERLHLLLTLVPHVGYFPDFLNPAEALDGLDEGLEAIRSTPRPVLRREIERLAQSRRLPVAAGPIADGEPGALVELTDTMRTCYGLAIGPHHRRVHTALDRDRQLRATALAAHGVRGLFASLEPMVFWSGGELRVPGHRDQELRLDGRGLLLIPAYFCIGYPITLFEPDLPPVLVYPVARHADTLLIAAPGSGGALAALVGGTRAAVLQELRVQHLNTTELARRLAISAASASEHTTILRNAGLITSQRDRNRVMHRLTPLGYALLAEQD